MNNATIPMPSARRGLATVWFTGGLIFLSLIIVQTIFGAYPDNEKAWGWTLPNIMPTLLLIVGVLVAEKDENLAKVTVSLFLYKLTMRLSIFYLAVAILVILLAPLTDKPKLEVMQSSSIFLGPLQGLVGAAFGAFFIARNSGAAPTPPAP